MRAIRMYINIETPYLQKEFEIDFWVKDNLADHEIGKMAKELFESSVDWSWDEIDG